LDTKNVDNPKHRNGEVSKRIIVPDESVAPLIREIFTLYATGNYNGLELNELMYEKGFRSYRGRKLNPSMFYKILANPIYVGEFKYGDAYVKEAKHEPLVSRQIFERVQSVLASRNHHATRRRKYFFLLRGLVRCNEHTHKRYTAEYHEKKSGRKYAYYHCTNRSGCEGGYVGTDYLEDEVAIQLKSLSFSKSFTDRVIHHARKKFESYKDEDEQIRRRLNAQKAKLTSRKNIAMDKLFDGVLSDEEFTKVKEEIYAELKKINKELIRLDSKEEIKVDIAQEVIKFARDAYGAYIKASPTLKRNYLLLFFKDIYVYNGKVQSITHTKLFDVLLELNALKTERASIKSDSRYIKAKIG